MNLDRGFISPYFATSSEDMICELDSPCILLTTKKITNISQILNIVEGAAKTGRSLFIVADDVEGEALSVLIVNRVQGRIKVCAIRAPGFGEYRNEILKDIGVLTDSQVITDESGDSLEDVEFSPGSGVIGSAQRVVVSKNSTKITGGAGDLSNVTARIGFINNLINEAGSEYEKEKLKERVVYLSDSIKV